MTKDELIEKLQAIDGNPLVLLNDAELGCIPLNDVKTDKMHQAVFDKDCYITKDEYESEIGSNTYFHDNYHSETVECVLLKGGTAL